MENNWLAGVDLVFFGGGLRQRSLCSVFNFIRFCRYSAPVHIAPFLYKNGEKNIRFRAFTLLTKMDKNLSVFVIYDRSHCSVLKLVKLQKELKP